MGLEGIIAQSTNAGLVISDFFAKLVRGN